MKKAGVLIAALLCIALVCGGFYFVKNSSDRAQTSEKELTEVEKLITKDLSLNYPATPREVVKLYNRIITCYYKDKLTDEQLSRLCDQVLCLFDQELAEINPKDTFEANVKADIANYARKSKYIAQSSVCDSRDVIFLQMDGDDLAYVTSSYFVKEENKYSRTYQQYVMRKDADGKWKIIGFYQINEDPSEKDDK